MPPWGQLLPHNKQSAKFSHGMTNDTYLKQTWQQLILGLTCLYSCADKGNPHVLGSYIVLVRAAEDVDV